MSTPEVQQIIQKIESDLATPADFRELTRLINEDETGMLAEWVHAQFSAPVTDLSFDRAKWESIANDIVTADKLSATNPSEHLKPIHPTVHKAGFMHRWIWVAASIVIMLGVGTYFWMTNNKDNYAPEPVVSVTEVHPGKEGALLTLADGSLVSLDSIHNGQVLLTDGSRAKVVDGQLIYEGKAKQASYNIMSTPRGRIFRLLLPDGTKVWLNAASSIRFPTTFNGKERRVEVKGEAYLEVAKNQEMPFRISVNQQMEVEVLGTHFNINAYDNEEMLSTTLVSGAVQVTALYPVSNDSDRMTITLKPGQQAQLVQAVSNTRNPKNGGFKIINNPDVEKILAWKNGLFNFKDVSLAELMHQLERWYDIEVIYPHGIPSVELTGEISRGVTLNELLTAMERMGVHHTLEGKKLIILP
ncbi:MAG: FecR domain-containing protein [Chitinophagaceae bacterium]|nr:FecR domain-containing protein [Chitinophagaceae bacterium]